jgi:hypothetical protein
MSGTTFSGFMAKVAMKFHTMAPSPKLQMAAPVAKLYEVAASLSFSNFAYFSYNFTGLATIT